jgi:hypothetical protein
VGDVGKCSGHCGCNWLEFGVSRVKASEDYLTCINDKELDLINDGQIAVS